MTLFFLSLSLFFFAKRSVQILCIHLKRFRHEVMYSFKISSHVSFPLEGLNMQPFLAKDSPSQVTTYDLLSVICHHGTAGSMRCYHFRQIWARANLLRLSRASLLIQVDTTLLTVRMWSTASGTSSMTSTWQKSTRRSCRTQKPMCCSTGERPNAVGLFFRATFARYRLRFLWICCRKSSEESVRERQKVVALASMKEPSLLQFYISREWLNKFNTFAEPGPISNHTFLCQHGGPYLRDSPCQHARHKSKTLFLFCTGIPPNKYHYIDDLVVIVPQNVWEYLYNRWSVSQFH